MADKYTTAHCYVCGKQSRYVKPRINHVLHLILTILTVGVWGLVWLILGISNSSKPLRCVTCGTAKGSGKRAAQKAAAQGVGAAGTAAAAGWYPDPEDSNGRRYWDGAAWTEHSDPPRAAEPPALPGPTTATPAAAAQSLDESSQAAADGAPPEARPPS